VLLGAAFLMATSAIGPGFLTQTTVFTERLGASFGFAILISILFDLGAQLNVWRIVVASGRRAQEVADAVLPGLGTLLTVLVAIGGLAFNIGNIAGCGLGLEAMTGVSAPAGAIISAAIGIWIFLVREAGKMMDRFAQLMGFVMVGLTIYIAIVSQPPLRDAALRTVWPSRLDAVAIVTLVGGTVGGYITFAGAHRLLDAGVSGPQSVDEATRSASSGILIASIMRVVLFLAALGVVSHGHALGAANPAAEVFRAATGTVGYRLFGIVMWAAAITSVVGSAYTSVSFLRSLSSVIEQHWRATIVAFIVASTIVFLVVGQPVKTLIFVGALNGLVLPVSLGLMLAASRSERIVGTYRHPLWMILAGVLVVVCMGALSVYTIISQVPKILH